MAKKASTTFGYECNLKLPNGWPSSQRFPEEMKHEIPNLACPLSKLFFFKFFKKKSWWTYKLEFIIQNHKILMRISFNPLLKHANIMIQFRIRWTRMITIMTPTKLMMSAFAYRTENVLVQLQSSHYSIVHLAFLDRRKIIAFVRVGKRVTSNWPFWI